MTSLLLEKESGLIEEHNKFLTIKFETRNYNSKTIMSIIDNKTPIIQIGLIKQAQILRKYSKVNLG